MLNVIKYGWMILMGSIMVFALLKFSTSILGAASFFLGLGFVFGIVALSHRMVDRWLDGR